MAINASGTSHTEAHSDTVPARLRHDGKAPSCASASPLPRQKPKSAAARMTSGKGRPKQNNARKASAAITQSLRDLRARLATRSSASMTMASTAALIP